MADQYEFYDDVYGADLNKELPDLKLAIKYNYFAQKNFNKANPDNTLEKIIAILGDKAWECYLSKVSDKEMQILVPIDLLNGQLVMVVKYDPLNYVYFMIVKYGEKSRFRNSSEFPDPNYRIDVKASFLFLLEKEKIPRNDIGILQPMSKIWDEVMAMEIEPDNSKEKQHAIWENFIKANKRITNTLSLPFPVGGKLELRPNLRKDDKGVSSWSLTVPLRQELKDPFRPLVETYEKEFNNQLRIEPSGVAYITRRDIERRIPAAIRRENDAFILSPEKSCIIAIKPLPLIERINRDYGDYAEFKEHGPTHIFAYNLKISPEELAKKLKMFGLRLAKKHTTFTVRNVSDLMNCPQVKEFNINFTDSKKFLKGANKELALPMPSDGNKISFENIYSNEGKDAIEFLEKALEFIFGKENIAKENAYRFTPENPDMEKGFTDTEWEDVRIDLMTATPSFEYNFSNKEGKSKTISFDFKTFEEMQRKYDVLASLKSFVIIKSPMDDDFGFKVTFSLAKTKTEDDIFREKIKKLAGVIFNPVIDGEVKYNLSCGTLVAKESDTTRLVFKLPYWKINERNETDKFRKFYEENGSNIEAVKANLKGDLAKIEWQEDTLKKIDDNNLSEAPNAKAVNPKIKEFVYDSSKAIPSAKYLERDMLTPVDITQTPEFKNFDASALLSLNDSQKQAVLKAVEAQDLCLLQGPPGTGKTTVIAELACRLILRNLTSKDKILVTSETNLAVDNALELMRNGKNVNENLSRNLSLIKPLRLGKSDKLEDEGKRYSLERIKKWADQDLEIEDDEEEGSLSDDSENDEDGNMDTSQEDVAEDLSDNVVQAWMSSIANRSKGGTTRYREILKDWTSELSLPRDTDVKNMFLDTYLKNVNIVGSTCTSTGGTRFLYEYLISTGKLQEQFSYKEFEGIMNSWKKHGNIAANDRIKKLASYLGINPKNLSPEELKQAVSNACKVEFDTVIMDEASKATPPELFMPLCFGKKSVVIGDHRQLPPMLHEKSFKETLDALESKEADSLKDFINKDLIKNSQFKKMILDPGISPTIKHTFNEQYRMHPQINDVISQFYERDECGGLKCGLDPDKVDSPDLNDPQSRYHGLRYKDILRPDLHTIWINVEAPEESKGSSKINDKEVDAINKVLEMIAQSDGFKQYNEHWDNIPDKAKRKAEKEVGIISFYGPQVGNIRSKVKKYAEKSLGIPAKINTVDKFQGMERNIVIVSTVRSNKAIDANGKMVDNFNYGFADSPERLNVALSRARRLLIVVGNRKFFEKAKDDEGNLIYKNAIDVIERNGGLFDYKDL